MTDPKVSSGNAPACMACSHRYRDSGLRVGELGQSHADLFRVQVRDFFAELCRQAVDGLLVLVLARYRSTWWGQAPSSGNEQSTGRY